MVVLRTKPEMPPTCWIRATRGGPAARWVAGEVARIEDAAWATSMPVSPALPLSGAGLVNWPTSLRDSGVDGRGERPLLAGGRAERSPESAQPWTAAAESGAKAPSP